jgi:hypothetical protein
LAAKRSIDGFCEPDERAARGLVDYREGQEGEGLLCRELGAAMRARPAEVENAADARRSQGGQAVVLSVTVDPREQIRNE